MPSWSSRLHPGPSTSSSSAAHANVSSAIPVAERTVPIPVNNDVPVLIPFETPHPSARRSHSRSISHPFPSLFGGGNRKNSKGVSKQDFLDSDDDDDIVTYAPDPRSNSPRKASQRPGPAEDVHTGKCMTCDSTVKWPRDVKVFRCTVCLTVNDLEPHRGSGDAPHHGPSGRTEAPAAKGIHRKGTMVQEGKLGDEANVLKLSPYQLNGRRGLSINASRPTFRDVWISSNRACRLRVLTVSVSTSLLCLRQTANAGQRHQVISGFLPRMPSYPRRQRKLGALRVIICLHRRSA